MRDLLPEVVEPLLVLGYGAIVSVLAVAGVGAELVGLSDLLIGGGLETTALWFVYLGAVGLAGAIVVARRQLLPLLARRGSEPVSPSE